MDDALADTDTDTAINAAHTAIAINADITAHIVIDSDTAIDINTVININAASDIDIAISAAATTVRGQAPSSPSHVSHICMHVMLAYGDADLVLAMNADTDTNSAYLTGAAGATAPHLANSAGPFRGSMVRRAVLVAGRPGRQCGGIAEPAEARPSRPVQRHSLAHTATQSAAVAWHQGQKAGLRCGR